MIDAEPFPPWRLAPRHQAATPEENDLDRWGDRGIWIGGIVAFKRPSSGMELRIRSEVEPGSGIQCGRKRPDCPVVRASTSTILARISLAVRTRKRGNWCNWNELAPVVFGRTLTSNVNKTYYRAQYKQTFPGSLGFSRTSVASGTGLFPDGEVWRCSSEGISSRLYLTLRASRPC